MNFNDSNSEWLAKFERLEKEHTDKLVEYQKDVDKLKYEISHKSKEIEKLKHILDHVFKYFLIERKIKIPKRDKDLFYLADILEEYYDDPEVHL